MVRIVNRFPRLFAAHAAAAALGILSLAICGSGTAQNARPPSAERTSAKPSSPKQEKPAEKIAPKLPAQIALLETHVRFESNGDNRKEIHALVKINDEAGARQFARLNFGYNRAFQSIEIPLARITHANGGTLDVLASAITDNPDPAVVNFPAYQDIRVKSLRILGLEPDDTFEYRVVTATTHHPLAPDFWLEHSFERSGIVSHEIFELDLPSSRKVQIKVNPATPATSNDKSGGGIGSRISYRWEHSAPVQGGVDNDTPAKEPDLLLTTFLTWSELSEKLCARLQPSSASDPKISAEAHELIAGRKSDDGRLEAIYDFVSQHIVTVDLPLGSANFVTRSPGEILSSGAGSAEDKYALFSGLALAVGISTNALLTGAPPSTENQLPTPGAFGQLIIGSFEREHSFWLDPSIEVAPFGMIPANLRGARALKLENWSRVLSQAPLGKVIHVDPWGTIEPSLPFPARQKGTITASLDSEGKLTTKVKYAMRGDNELLLRVAFHQSPREKWDGVAQLLALSDGFRGRVTKTVASDPYETHEPFSVSYEITQPKFLDWSKKPVRIPALLPLLGLPDPPAKSAPGAPAPPIELGTPLDVEVTATLHLPEDTGAEVPAGTSVERDFATYNSHYSVSGGTLTASRHINFILKEISADRAAEYNAFLHTVQNDESQFFTLERADATPATQKPK